MTTRAKIQKLIDTAPSSWKTMFKRYRLGTRPSVDDLIQTVLDYTPTMRSSGEKGDALYKVPAQVKKEAWKGLVLSHENNYTSASGIGLVRAMQLIVQPRLWERSVKRMRSYLTRHEVDKKGRNFGNDADPSRGYMAWLNWGGDSGKRWVDNMKQNPRANRKKKKGTRDKEGRFIPEKYLAGYRGKAREARVKELGKRRTEYQRAISKYGDEDNFPKSVLKKLYRPFKTDKGRKGKKSSYTEVAKERGFTGSIANKAKVASQYYGGSVAQSILKEVRARGMAAWSSGGHRPGQTSHSWGNARVNSFLVGGKTFSTSDSDLASKLPRKVQNAIKREAVYKANPDGEQMCLYSWMEAVMMANSHTRNEIGMKAQRDGFDPVAAMVTFDMLADSGEIVPIGGGQYLDADIASLRSNPSGMGYKNVIKGPVAMETDIGTVVLYRNPK